MSTPDLTPFGFTPTESMAYAALLRRGPVSAYSLARFMSIARANTYQALEGLAAKRAAVLVSENPRVYRPVKPSTLLAAITERETSKLESLESQLHQVDPGGEPDTIAFTSLRTLKELVLRTALRADRVDCIAQPEVLSALAPVWRRRASDERTTRLWAVGTAPTDIPVEISGQLDAHLIEEYFGAPAVLVLTQEAVILGTQNSALQIRGFWSSEPLWIAAVRTTAAFLTAT